MKVLFINVNEKSFWEENVEHEKIKGILDLGIFFHLEKYKSYSKHVFSPENALVIGCGNLSYSGSQRAVFIFRSPLHEEYILLLWEDSESILKKQDIML